MNPELNTFTIASRSLSRSDSYHFVCSFCYLIMAARDPGKLPTTVTQRPQNLRLHASLAQPDGRHLRMQAPPTRVLLIQYP